MASKYQEIIKALNLEPHPKESGYFRRTYTSNAWVTQNRQPRRLGSSIYYLLTAEQPRNILHRNRSDILHFFHLGGALKYTWITESGQYKEDYLGQGYQQGQHLQLCVPGNCWKAAELVEGEYALISEVVLPGFDFADNEIATEAILTQWPEHAQKLRPLLSAAAPASK